MCDVPWYSSLSDSVLVFDKADATQQSSWKGEEDVQRVSCFASCSKIVWQMVGSFRLRQGEGAAVGGLDEEVPREDDGAYRVNMPFFEADICVAISNRPGDARTKYCTLCWLLHPSTVPDCDRVSIV